MKTSVVSIDFWEGKKKSPVHILIMRLNGPLCNKQCDGFWKGATLSCQHTTGSQYGDFYTALYDVGLFY